MLASTRPTIGCAVLLPVVSMVSPNIRLTQLRAAIGRTWPVSVSVRSVRSCRIFGRLSALRIRMTIAYSPNPRHNNRSNHPRPRPNGRTSEADGRSAIGDLRATNDERRSPTGARGLPGAAPACGLRFYFIFGKKNTRTPQQSRCSRPATHTHLRGTSPGPFLRPSAKFSETTREKYRCTHA